MRLIRFSLSLLTLLAAASTSAQPAVSFSDDGVTLSGLTPGGPVAWISVSLEPTGVMNRVVPRQGYDGDLDYDGIVTIPLGSRPALRSTWAVVDVTTGAYAVGTPEDFVSTPIVPGDRLQRARGLRKALDALEIERNEVHILGVRPGVGAWTLQATEGSSVDRDSMNDQMLTVRFADLVSLGDVALAPPTSLQSGDVLIVIDMELLSHFAAVAGR